MAENVLQLKEECEQDVEFMMAEIKEEPYTDSHVGLPSEVSDINVGKETHQEWPEVVVVKTEGVATIQKHLVEDVPVAAIPSGLQPGESDGKAEIDSQCEERGGMQIEVKRELASDEQAGPCGESPYKKVKLDEDVAYYEEKEDIYDVTYSSAVPDAALTSQGGHTPNVHGALESFSSKQSHLKEKMKLHSDDTLFPCELCDYKGNRSDSMKLHMMTHTGERPHACHICDHKFKRPADLKYHIRSHTRENLYECSFCDFKCIKPSYFKNHMMVHTGETPFVCDICNFKFTQSTHLKEHQRIHTGEMPYSCEACDYKCNRLDNLKRHMLTHTEELPYSCKACDYKCRQSSNLKQHMRVHSGDMLYACGVCDYKCNNTSHLRVHMRIHSRERPYTCELCDYKCSQASHLKQHIIRIHS